MGFTGRELRSTIDDGKLTLSLEQVRIDDPADDEIVVRVEAAPINPSDLGLLLGPADIATLERRDGGDGSLTFDIPPARLAGVAARLGQSMPVGNEGAGTVVAAGRNAAALEGRRVGMIGGGMYADYRRIKASEVIPLPEGATAASGASMFVNPLTALGFVETARREGHKAIIHTAAASNLGQMLQKVCLRDGIPLVNIVRSTQQADILNEIGAAHVINSKDDDFAARLAEAVEQTGATLAFDAIGGGTLGSDIMQAMEQAQVRAMPEYNRYGSPVFKQLYIYGALDTSPTILNRLAFGFQWGVSGWLLFPFLQKAGPEVVARLRRRVIDELTTTFASKYTRVIGLAEALEPDVLQAYERKATGEKFLIDPSAG
ncbi:zinc-binding dehydrogenase [Novosphingobium aerophilum]|uniref:zinc-binding dehydrogenase n=1 Tax=Novosphingobium TaxID=165696 RepID=UPI0012C3EB5A|nr:MULTISPECIES: zinc-binding dehydrogenase [unclassified Novosphingobium]MPS70139.1 NADH oxidase [Novosphingobium sp.]WRT95842.1 zinc-binding dehydrogenase [Novosphingobium sp. RL4]